MVARSSDKSEFKAMAQGIWKLLWLKLLLKELRLVQEDAMMLHCDNISAISISHKPMEHDRNKKHIEGHHIKETIESIQACIPFVPSSKQSIDGLTKGLSRPISY